MTRLTNRAKILLLLTTALSFFALRTIYIAFQSSLQDFTYYLGAASNFLSGKNPYLSYPSQVYPPASLFLLTPLSLLPPSLSHSLWTTTSLASLFFALHIFSTIIFKSKSVISTLFLFILSLQTFPVKYALAQGQINFLVFLCFALFFDSISKKRNHLAGLILSLAVSLKFNPIFLVLYLLITKNTKALLAFILCFTILNLSIDLFTAHSLNNSFLHSITNMSTHYSGYYYNTSLAALTSRLFSQPLASIINLSLSALIWFITLIVSRKSHHLLTFSLFLITILLTSPIAWQHYLFWSILAFLTLVSINTKHKNLPYTLFLLLSFILINLNIKDPQTISIQSPLYSHATFGLLLLYLLLVSKHQTIRRQTH